MQEYYEKFNLLEFGNRADPAHQLGVIMEKLGKNIIASLDDFNFPKNLNIINDNPKFKICTPKDMKLLSGTLEEIRMHNSMYDENVFRLTKDTKIQFPKEFEGYFVIGVHTWNKGGRYNQFLDEYSNLVLENKMMSLSKESNCHNVVLEFNNDFQIDEKSYVRYNQEDTHFTEYFQTIGSWHKNAKKNRALRYHRLFSC